jgi:phosphoribosylaminoimidazole carboxylase (NCAIR synthetase)
MKITFFTLLLSLLVINHQAQAAEKCLFGNEISSLTEQSSDIFSVKFLGDFVKTSRLEAESENKIVRVHVYEVKETKTNKIYHLNYTYEDQFDGGNAIGWIEDFTSLEVVSKIGDSRFYDCKLKK